MAELNLSRQEGINCLLAGKAPGNADLLRETTVAMDWVKFFALDEFGTFGVIPDELKYVDFVSDLAEEIQPPEVHDSAQNAK